MIVLSTKFKTKFLFNNSLIEVIEFDDDNTIIKNLFQSTFLI